MVRNRLHDLLVAATLHSHMTTFLLRQSCDLNRPFDWLIPPKIGQQCWKETACAILPKHSPTLLGDVVASPTLDDFSSQQCWPIVRRQKSSSVRSGQVCGHTPEQRVAESTLLRYLASVWPSLRQTPGPPCPYPSDNLTQP